MLGVALYWLSNLLRFGRITNTAKKCRENSDLMGNDQIGGSDGGYPYPGWGDPLPGGAGPREPPPPGGPPREIGGGPSYQRLFKPRFEAIRLTRSALVRYFRPARRPRNWVFCTTPKKCDFFADTKNLTFFRPARNFSRTPDPGNDIFRGSGGFFGSGGVFSEKRSGTRKIDFLDPGPEFRFRPIFWPGTGFFRKTTPGPPKTRKTVRNPEFGHSLDDPRGTHFLTPDPNFWVLGGSWRKTAGNPNSDREPEFRVRPQKSGFFGKTGPKPAPTLLYYH